jgi:hypothetical protein
MLGMRKMQSGKRKSQRTSTIFWSNGTRMGNARTMQKMESRLAIFTTLHFYGSLAKDPKNILPNIFTFIFFR